MPYTQVVFYLVDLLQDKNKEVRKTADMALDVVRQSNLNPCDPCSNCLRRRNLNR